MKRGDSASCQPEFVRRQDSVPTNSSPNAELHEMRARLTALESFVYGSRPLLPLANPAVTTAARADPDSYVVFALSSHRFLNRSLGTPKRRRSYWRTCLQVLNPMKLRSDFVFITLLFSQYNKWTSLHESARGALNQLCRSIRC